MPVPKRKPDLIITDYESFGELWIHHKDRIHEVLRIINETTNEPRISVWYTDEYRYRKALEYIQSNLLDWRQLDLIAPGIFDKLRTLIDETL